MLSPFRVTLVQATILNAIANLLAQIVDQWKKEVGQPKKNFFVQYICIYIYYITFCNKVYVAILFECLFVSDCDFAAIQSTYIRFGHLLNPVINRK